ncbi:MAG: MFS transporter [Oceanisphaera sp.]|nr:MFS transporter [Oceanisphaera sp.]
MISDPSSSRLGNRTLATNLIVTGLCRLVLNTARRFAYPFAPEISRGLGVPLTHVTAMLAVNQASGILGLFAGPLADRFGFRIAMLTGLVLLAAGMLTAGLLPTALTVLSALFLSGLAKNIFDPAIQAYVGEHVPYHHRGRVIGLIETSWAGSTLIGIPLVGLVIAAYGWQRPFVMMGLLGLAGIVAIGIGLPPDRPHRDVPVGPGLLLRAWRQLAQSRAARALLIMVFLISMANDGLFVITGAWLEQQFNLSVAAIGFGTVVIGLSELCGEFITAALADRMGKKRAILIGLGLATIAYAALPIAGQSLKGALVGLFGLFLSVEFTIVTTFSLATEVLPDQRATMMSGLLAAAGLGRMAGALSGGWLWIAGGLPAVTACAAILNAVAVIVIIRRLRGRRG